MDRVFFAGEATTSIAPSSVQGAIQTGTRAANEVTAAGSPGEKIAVIGAGAAGATAARLLALRGFEVVVVEARDRVGGRIHTRDRDDAVPTELGAWRLGEQSAADVIATLGRLAVVTAPLAATVVRAAGAETATNTVGQKAFATAISWAAAQRIDAPLALSLTDSGAADAASSETVSTDGADIAGAALLTAAIDTVSARMGAPAESLSSWFGFESTTATQSGGSPTDPAEAEVAVLGDFTAVIDDALDGVETFLSTVVVGIAYSDSGVSLRLGTGESLAVDRTIVTVPLGVLKGDGIEFDPLLPFGHRSAIEAMGFGTVDTVWLRFDEPFWTTDAVIWQSVGTDSPFASWFNLEPLTGEAILVGIVGGDAATTLAEASDDEFTSAALAGLTPFVGEPA
jgi:monoamine oxidase